MKASFAQTGARFFYLNISMIIVLTVGIHPGAGQTVYVPSTHWVYRFLDRLEAKRVLPVVLDSTLPMTRAEISRHLSSLIDNKDRLSRVEKQQLEFLRQEFREELGPDSSLPSTDMDPIIRNKWIDPWLPDIIYKNGRNLLSLSSGPLDVYWDPILLFRRMYATADTLTGRERVFENTGGFVLWGTLGHSVGFYTDVRDTREWGTRRNIGYRNMTAEGFGFVQGGGDFLYHDETIAYVVFNHRFLTLQFGKDSNRWGPGRRGQLALSDHATSYDMLKIQLGDKRWKFTSLVGLLQHFTEDFFYGDHQEKMLAAHRVEFSPVKALDIGLHETVIYSGRRFEPAYLNPVMFFRSAEHYLGDRDNAAMGMDIEVKVLPKTALYGELFIDDLSTGRLGTGFYGNKYGILGGFYHVDLLGIPQLDILVEYTRIRPYTYTHKYDINGYRHFSTLLGHWIGPNSENLYCELTYRLSRRLCFESFYELTRHGANSETTNYGGDYLLPHRYPIDPQYVDFLAGCVEDVWNIGLGGSYEFLRNIFLRVRYRHLRGDFAGKGKNCDPYPGKRSELTFQMSLNY